MDKKSKNLMPRLYRRDGYNQIPRLYKRNERGDMPRLYKSDTANAVLLSDEKDREQIIPRVYKRNARVEMPRVYKKDRTDEMPRLYKKNGEQVIPGLYTKDEIPETARHYRSDGSKVMPRLYKKNRDQMMPRIYKRPYLQSDTPRLSTTVEHQLKPKISYMNDALFELGLKLPILKQLSKSHLLSTADQLPQFYKGPWHENEIPGSNKKSIAENRNLLPRIYKRQHYAFFPTKQSYNHYLRLY